MTELDRRVAAARLLLVVDQVGRVPLPLVVYNLAVLWLLWRADRAGIGSAWFAVCIAVDAYRWRRVRVERRAPAPEPTPVLLVMSALLIVNGVLQALPIAIVFGAGSADLQYILTLLLLGRSAGAISTAGGVVWAYVGWIGSAGAPLVAAWVTQRTIEGEILAGLIALLLAMLFASMRDQSGMLRRLVETAWQNELLTRQLRVERDRASEASESKTRFFAAASHDLRQPLHALAINTTTLDVLAHRHGDPELIELSRRIGRSLGQSNSLLDTLLDISQLEANAVQVRRRPTHAARALHALRDEFAAAAAQRGLTLSVQGVADAGVWLDTDPAQLHRMLANLLGNALKFTDRGGVTLALAPPDRPGGAATISVIDTGPGIAPTEHERVFEDFYQIGNPSRDRGRGLGLGLAIVRRTAALLGVKLELNSALGNGARFDLAIATCAAPAAHTAVDDAAATARADGDGPPAEAGSFGNDAALHLRVLAIDDEVDILESLAELLPRLGCEVRCATGLAEALALVDAGFAPSALLVDHRLRESTSGEAISELQRRLGPVPAVIVTGDTSPAELNRMLSSGAQILHKPLSGWALRQALQQATSSHGK